MFDANVFFKMASPLGLGGCSANGSTEATIVTPEMIEKALDSIKDPMQKVVYLSYAFSNLFSLDNVHVR